MIYIRKANLTDIDDISQILKENDLKIERLEDHIPNCMIALDGEQPVATAAFVEEKPVALIQFVAVKKERQKEYIGDGVVKALLSFAETKKICDTYVLAEDKNTAFFKKVGFKETENKQISTLFSKTNNKADSKHKLLYVTLPDFFKSACRAKQYKL